MIDLRPLRVRPAEVIRLHALSHKHRGRLVQHGQRKRCCVRLARPREVDDTDATIDQGKQNIVVVSATADGRNHYVIKRVCGIQLAAQFRQQRGAFTIAINRHPREKPRAEHAAW